ncbi:putative acetyltransferase [Pseudomonas asplenii]|uniref:Putative acetyltransferase n=1 Tax=Pseudomonas asplenii TaxID=53407 RepID=A0A0M9GK25_9PSED|nr:GNAT family N-acetyltransferase [Pseudomonas fuscovaginae]KPA92893.1 putative acetyltransferase [Pseudomonas fuscovaginae]
MLIERDLQLSDLGQLALIDRKELIEQFYRVQAGSLELYDEYCAMTGWPEGEAEQDAVILRRCFDQGAWFHGVFAGPTLVAAAVLDGKLIGNDGRRLLQLKFLHVSHDYRGTGLATRLFAKAAAQARSQGVDGLYVSATPSRNTVEFYLRRGCRLLERPDPGLYALEPDDIYLYFDVR